MSGRTFFFFFDIKKPRYASESIGFESVGYVASYLRHCMQEHKAKIYPLL
jgi:hypothetical protein